MAADETRQRTGRAARRAVAMMLHAMDGNPDGEHAIILEMSHEQDGEETVDGAQFLAVMASILVVYGTMMEMLEGHYPGLGDDARAVLNAIMPLAALTEEGLR